MTPHERHWRLVTIQERLTSIESEIMVVFDDIPEIQRGTLRVLERSLAHLVHAAQGLRLAAQELRPASEPDAFMEGDLLRSIRLMKDRAERLRRPETTAVVAFTPRMPDQEPA